MADPDPSDWFDGWTPDYDVAECPAGGPHTWTDDAGEITARYGVSVYCDECHTTYNPTQTERTDQ